MITQKFFDLLDDGRFSQDQWYFQQQEAEIAVPMGAITLGAQYAKRGDDKGYAVDASYALSKRTAVQAAYATIDTTSTAGTSYNGGQTRIRLNHTF